MSSSTMVNYKAVWSQVVGLRRQVEGLEQLVTHSGAKDPAAQILKCQVCGFLLKAHQTSSLSKVDIGSFVVGESSLKVPKVQGQYL